MMIADDDLLALCVWDEAAGEPFEGKAAVARVVLNRIDALFLSDGTVAGTVLHPLAFSGFWFDMRGGKYVRVAWTLEDAMARAETMLADAKDEPIWQKCALAVQAAKAGSTFAGGAQWQALLAQPRTLNYANLALCSPSWARPECKVAEIGHHTFFKD
jgi:spore germination cell wall hydrolase CwlJ-like protein